MSTPANMNLKEIIDEVDYGINVVNSDYDILFMNMATRKRWNITEPNLDCKCHKLLFDNDEPCSNCPILSMQQTGAADGQLVGALNTPDRPNHRVKYRKLQKNLYVQTLIDVTRETELVRQVTLQSKETQAQNTILKRKRKELEEHYEFLNSVFNSIHAGLLVLDSSPNLNVSTANKSIAAFVSEESEENLVKKKCFQLFGFQRRCPGCPIENVTERTNFSRLRYHQNVGDYTLTEYYSHLPFGRILLIFEDSTKRVHLVQQLKEHKEIIERQNQIFLSLLETSPQIQKADELEEIFNRTLEQLNNLFLNLGFGIILDGERPEIVECAVFLGFTEEEQLVVVEHHTTLLSDDVENTLVEKISERYSTFSEETAPPPSHWSVLPMLGRERRTIGKLLIKGTELDKQSKEIITLFLEQVASVAENKLLTQQLEKLANTDALTGTYNRGFFSRELDRAIPNAERYSIPFSILLIDVNGLKRVNDVFGHEEGDTMIIMVAKLLLEVCRKSDVVTRLGGDEFVVLCPSTKLEQADHLLGRIREKEAVTQMECTHPNGETEIVPIRMSIGVSSSEDTPADEVLKKADSLMYADKEAYYANRERYR